MHKIDWRPYLAMALCCLFSICVFAEEEMSIETKLEEANKIIEEEEMRNEELKEQLEEHEAEIAELREKLQALEEEIGK